MFCFQVLEPTERLGCEEKGGFLKLMEHRFFKDIPWSDLPTIKPPQLLPFLPALGEENDLWSSYKVMSEVKSSSQVRDHEHA